MSDQQDDIRKDYPPFYIGGKRVSERKPKRDPLIIATEKAYRASTQYQLDKLWRLEALYTKRETLARKGLVKTRKQIERLLLAKCEGRLHEPTGNK